MVNDGFADNRAEKRHAVCKPSRHSAIVEGKVGTAGSSRHSPVIGASRNKSENVQARERQGEPKRLTQKAIVKGSASMKLVPIAVALAALFAVSNASAQSPKPSANENTAPGVTAKPGKVGPGSENNTRVSPTSPSMTAQPPPDIPPGSTEGASSGSSGSAGQPHGSNSNQSSAPGKSGAPPAHNPSH